MKKQLINQEITSLEVFLIGEEGQAWGKTSRDQALVLAYQKELDLIQINPNSKPPVCKIGDYGKYLYNMTKKLQKQKSKQKTSELKEIKLSIRIDKHDLGVKIKKAKEFLDNGNKVRIFLRLKGREMMFTQKANEIIDQFRKELEAEFEQPIKRAGNSFSAILKRK